MLDEMGAEVICFQEHKARRDALTKDMALPEGYDAFFNFPTLPNKSGYSGTCVYTKRAYLVPAKAEEGITGRLLPDPGQCGLSSAGTKIFWTEGERIGGYPEEEQVTWVTNGEEGFDPKTLDMEGRAIVLDFGNVIVVGDLNVVHRPIDSGEGGIERRVEEMLEHPARVWLEQLLAGPEGMRDVTREKWEERKGMYTCWNTKLDARASNYGSRIDYILVTPSLLPWVAYSDIQPDIYGSDHCPVYLDLHESITGQDGKEILLRDLVNPPALSLPKGLADNEGERPEPPALATRFWDEFSGKQTSLKDFFGKKAASNNATQGKTGGAMNSLSKGKSAIEVPARRNRERSSSSAAGKTSSITLGLGIRTTSSCVASESIANSLNPDLIVKAATGGSTASAPTVALEANRASEEVIDLTNSTETSPVKPKRKASSTLTQSKRQEKKPRKCPAKGTEAQTDLSSFFRSPTQSTHCPRAPSPPTTPTSVHVGSRTEDEEADYQYAKALASAEEYIEEDEVADERSEVARRTWSNIFAKKVAPRCRVHNLPCKAFVTKISGKNKGKKFWLCSK
ncbi:hypothetical protein QFC19_002766 [Naganishia cerealis]|uniref:Uncharacterized protein n=1 Tax=Naganishia cerealis TaxID=610337 RepID=A0ACC2W7W2_9TREE|nr:hypothetical protein QFC19_002766 [Naganishia cerealis]